MLTSGTTQKFTTAILTAVLLIAVAVPAPAKKKQKRIPKIFYGNWNSSGSTSCPGGAVDQTYSKSRSRFRRFRGSGLKINTRFTNASSKFHPNGKFKDRYVSRIYTGACGPGAPFISGLFFTRGKWRIRGRNIVARGTQAIVNLNTGSLVYTRRRTVKLNRRGPRLATRSFASDGFAARSISRRGRGKSIADGGSKARSFDQFDDSVLYPHFHLPEDG